MKVAATAGRAYLQRILDDPLRDFKNPAVLTLIFVDRH